MGNINYHMAKEHNHGVVFCDLCGKKYNGVADLKRHTANVHVSEKTLCQFCNKQFANKEYLDRHIKTMHTSNGEKPHQCPHCEKAFATKQSLESHVNMHLGLKPYKCEFVDKDFKMYPIRLHTR